MTRRIAISTHKGGAGKTSTALALASGLAHQGSRCLLIDLDPQGHCAPGLGVEVSTPTLKEFFQQHPTLPLRSVIIDTTVPNLHLAPSDLGLAWIAESLGGRPKREELLGRSLRAIEADYDWILIDTPPNLGVLTQNAVAAADFVLIPVAPDARANNAVEDLLNVVVELKGDTFSGWGILLTKVDARKTRSNSVIRDSLGNWKTRVFRTVIPVSEPLNQAQMAGRDLFSFDPKSPGAIAYRDFISELHDSL